MSKTGTRTTRDSQPIQYLLGDGVWVNWQPNAKYDHVFAIIRIDMFHSDDVPLQDVITVKKVVWTAEAAEAEVNRLNALKNGRKSMYFWELTRLERKAGTQSAAPSSSTNG